MKPSGGIPFPRPRPSLRRGVSVSDVETASASCICGWGMGYKLGGGVWCTHLGRAVASARPRARAARSVGSTGRHLLVPPHGQPERHQELVEFDPRPPRARPPSRQLARGVKLVEFGEHVCVGLSYALPELAIEYHTIERGRERDEAGGEDERVSLAVAARFDLGVASAPGAKSCHGRRGGVRGEG